MAIAEDLLVQILLLLPVVSLLRFKCVSKSWYALITHQNFIEKHLLHNLSTSNNRARFLAHRRDKTTGDYVISRLSYEPLQVLPPTQQPLPLPYSGVDKKVEVFVVGSCNGLVCLYDNYDLNVVVWNPATKETKVVPKSTVPRSPAAFQASVNGIGFGFDAKTNDYKIIKLLCLYDPDPNLSYYQTQFIDHNEVYSLSNNSWRKVDSPLCHIFDGFKGMKAYTNGIASWWGLCGFESILSFDMSKEAFLITPLPDERMIGGRDENWREFFVLNEKVALAVTIEDEEQSETRFDVWLLNEYGVKESWSKLFTLGPLTGIRKPLGFWKNETALFLESSDGQLVVYDTSTKEISNLPIDGEPYSLQVITYVETIVSVKGGNEFEVEEQGGS
ncbi:F-box/kelch-repeat protein At3g06240-like [Corylus avellana]|uniref:F-box/kelch-repeat protein At3g06240-like n=1 Tax=Corylus avellana TaxID=13451 RepID=UPI00286CA405|nr:F-box/kelch-repeat protein At3g06240-like [Corylus avellana]